MPQNEIRQDPNFVVDEVNAYVVTMLTGQWCVGLFDKMKAGTDALGGATVNESYAMTYLMGIVDMAEMCARVARGWTMDDVIAHIDTRVEELCVGFASEQEKRDDEEEEGAAE